MRLFTLRVNMCRWMGGVVRACPNSLPPLTCLGGQGRCPSLQGRDNGTVAEAHAGDVGNNATAAEGGVEAQVKAGAAEGVGEAIGSSSAYNWPGR